MSSLATARRGGLVALDLEHDAYLYTRVSSDEQGNDGLSLPNQEHRGLIYISQKGWRHRGTFTDVLSGRRDDRPGYQAALREIRGAVLNGQRPVLVVNMLDRLGRKIKERVRVWEELSSLGVPIHAVNQGEFNELTYNVLAAVAQEESRQTSERVHQVRERLREQGWHEPGRAPWGYRWRDATPDERAAGAPKSALEVHPDEAPYVREAWARLATGTSLCELARWVPTLPSVARGGRNLNFGVLREMFRAPVYVARTGNGDDVDSVLDRPRGRWPRLVDDETWLVVRASVDKGKRKLPAQARGDYLLTGILRCDRCGSRMAGNTKRTQRKKSGVCRTYVCTGYSRGARRAGTCRSHGVSADQLDERALVTVAELLAIASEPNVVDAARAAWESEARAYADDPDVERVGGIDREIVKTRGRMQRNHTLFVDGDITKEAYVMSQTEYQRELDLLEADRARCVGRVTKAPLPPLYTVLEQVRGWYGAFERARSAGDTRALRAVFAELLESAVPVPLQKFGRYEMRPTFTRTGKALLDTAFRFGASVNVASVHSFGTTNMSTLATSRGALARAV